MPFTKESAKSFARLGALASNPGRIREVEPLREFARYRRCICCGNFLSRFNPDDICSPCAPPDKELMRLGADLDYRTECRRLRVIR